uniref:Uncharacterized protein n=1 Tax=Eutreptiella gymnastica TaxID=73025 RepID=A0A6T2AB51_9EUGL
MALVSYNGFRFLCNAFLLLNAVLHPVMAFINPRMAAMCYRQALLAAVVGYAASLWISNRSKIQFNLQFAQQVSSSADAQYFMNTLIFFLTGYVNLLLLAPLCVYAAFSVADTAKTVVKPKAPSLYERFFQQRTTWLFSKTNEAMLYVALMEVMLGLFMVAGVFTRSNSLIHLVVYWNFLSGRYRTNKATQTVFGQLKQKIDGWTYHRFCPSVVRLLWAKVAGLLSSVANR